MKVPDYGLKGFVHRTLALRLILGGAIIATLLSVTTYVNRFDDIGDAAIVHALTSIEHLRARAGQNMETPGSSLAAAIQRALDEDPEQRVVSRHGNFVYARFYTAEGETLATRAQPKGPGSAQVDDFLQQSILQFPTLDEPGRKVVRIGARPYIDIALAIPDGDGNIVAHAEGLYALSDATIADARAAALRTSIYVMLIVLATSLLLYPLILTLTKRLASHSERLLGANLETIKVLGNAIAKRDSDTDAHNYRVTLYAIHLGEAAHLDAEAMQGLIKGAFLHDVGKIGIRDNILLKPAKLDNAEFSTMKTHVDHGLEIIGRSSWLDDASDVVGCHHEKYDGSGYPHELKGENIPIGARIFAIADVFDALTSRRPYKEPLSFEQTMAILEQGRDAHFDPAMLDLFAGMAHDLYQRYGGTDDSRLHEQLSRFMQHYFSAGPRSLS